MQGKGRPMENDGSSGEKLNRNELIAVLVHYYRAEVTRSLAWRERLDRTTNWAVGAAAAFIGFSFTHAEIHHGICLFALAILYTLLYVEARRYRFYDAYEYRVRLLHQYFIYGVLNGRLDMEEGSFWVAELASDLRYPQYKMDFLSAIAQRFKANYVYLFAILLICWLVKIALHPQQAHSWSDYLDQAALGGMPGWAILLFIAVFVLHGIWLMKTAGQPQGGGDIINPPASRK
jgi:uncharacterized membrane protein